MDQTWPQRLIDAREQLGASREQAAAWSQLPVEVVERAEAGAAISSTELEMLCRGLVVSPQAILSGGNPDPKRTPAFFRTAVGPEIHLSAGDLRTLQVVAQVSRMVGYLATELGMPSKIRELRRLEPVQVKREEPWQQGYRLGEAARTKLEKPDQPLLSLRQVFFGLGIHLVELDLSPTLEGASIWQPGGLPVVLLNRRSRRVAYSLSRRAILGHELCHLLHDGGEAEVLTRVSSAEDQGNYTDRLEQRARGFSPAFIAPPKAVLAFWVAQGLDRLPPEERVSRLATTWGLSFEGAIWHARNCELLSQDLADTLAREARAGELPKPSLEGWEEPLANPDPPGENVSALLSGLAAGIVLQAAKADLISEGRCRELLAWR